MCAQFLIKARLEWLEEKFGIKPTQLEFEERIVPYTRAPVIIKNKEGQIVVRSMNFSLIPPWSDVPKAKFSTHNARLDTILEKPLWVTPLSEKRCLVPINSFIEPIYRGPYAGNMVAFKDKDNEVLFAAGIWSEWLNKKTGEVVESFAILTGDPYPFVRETGHDRSPLFVDEKVIDQWLSPEKQPPAKMKELIISNILPHDFEVSVDRPMAKGWEKRIPKLS